MHLANNLLLCAGAGLDTLGGRTVEVVLGNPALVDGGDTGRSTDGGRDSLVAGEGGVGVDIGGKRFARGLGARSLGALSLGEESLDPGLVDEVEDATEGSGEEEVEEDAGTYIVSICKRVTRSWARWRFGYIWGSKKLVGASTMAAVPLKTGREKILP